MNYTHYEKTKQQNQNIRLRKQLGKVSSRRRQLQDGEMQHDYSQEQYDL